MSTTINLFLRLKELQPDPPIVTGAVSADMGAGMVRVDMDSGGVLLVRNPLDIAVGQSVFVQNGAITGEAPTLPYMRIEI